MLLIVVLLLLLMLSSHLILSLYARIPFLIVRRRRRISVLTVDGILYASAKLQNIHTK